MRSPPVVTVAKGRTAALITAGVVAVVAAFGITYLILTKVNEPHHKSEVVTLHFEPIPEGISIQDQHQGDPAWRALPDDLPDPLRQPVDCPGGAMVTLTLSSGETINYGPCARPSSIDLVSCRLLYPNDTPVSCPLH